LEIPECFIRVLNLSPATAYAKVYDGIANVRVDHGFVDFAVEYERTLKSPAKYEKIRKAIESEKRVQAFVYHCACGIVEGGGRRAGQQFTQGRGLTPSDGPGRPA
jgi:hypothetical protein